MNQEVNLTENGDSAFATSGSKNLDFFTRIVRGAQVEDIIGAFIDAWSEDANIATSVLMNLRDPRSGKQEKLIPIVILVYLKYTLPVNVYSSILETMVQYGYWKDLLKIHEIAVRMEVSKKKKFTMKKCPIELSLLANQVKIDYDTLINSDNGSGKVTVSLAGKWAPTDGTHYDHHPMFSCKLIRAHLGMTNKEYRQMLVKLREHINVLEMLMCTQQFDKIDFSKIPGVAMKKMSKAFNRTTNSDGMESEERKQLNMSYKEFLEKLKKGETKVNITGIQPHELVDRYYHDRGNDVDDLVEEQWITHIKKIMECGSFNKVTAVVDVSGSMEGEPMKVAISLGITVAECTTGPFAKQIITFHEKPSWHKLTGLTLKDKVHCMKQCPWGGSTNLRAVFQLILDEALRYQLVPEQMVDTLFVFTDMQFDSAFNGSNGSTFVDAKDLFESNGYKLPKIVFWNLKTSTHKIIPVEQGEKGVVLLSGFSSELLKCVINGDDYTPITMMMHVLEPYVNNIQNVGLGKFPYDLLVLSKAIEKSQVKKGFKQVDNGDPLIKKEDSDSDY